VFPKEADIRVEEEGCTQTRNSSRNTSPRSISLFLPFSSHTFFRGATLLANVQPRRQPRASSIFV